MNTTTASCGHSVTAVGAPGSRARRSQESMPCASCLIGFVGQTLPIDDTPVMPSVTIPLAALRDVLVDLRYAEKQMANVLDAAPDRLGRALDAMERVEAEIDGWLAVADAEQEGGIHK